MMMIFPEAVNSEVMPMLSPTVHTAEIASNRSEIIGIFSKKKRAVKKWTKEQDNRKK